jgi:RHS repeat-associated protein
VTDTHAYKPFGITTASGSNPNRFRFTGREWDQETGLYYYRARYYDAQIGRFISEDPVRFRGGPNFYDYVNSEPTDLIDPSGLSGSRPGGPYHPPAGVKTKCRESDSCEQIKGKIWILGRMIDSHTGWDTALPSPRGGNRHAAEIAALWIQLAECQALYQSKCKSSCDKGQQPQSNPQPDPWWTVFWQTFWDGVHEDQWEIEYYLKHPNKTTPPGLPPILPIPVPVIP